MDSSGGGAFAAMGLGVCAIAGIVGLVFLAFWIWMLIDAIKNCPEDKKILWIVLIVLLTWVGAAVYFFVQRPKNPKTPTAPPATR
jgi:hypothetical protein